MSQLVENPIRVSITSQQSSPVPPLTPVASIQSNTAVVMDKSESGDTRIDPSKLIFHNILNLDRLKLIFTLYL